MKNKKNINLYNHLKKLISFGFLVFLIGICLNFSTSCRVVVWASNDDSEEEIDDLEDDIDDLAEDLQKIEKEKEQEVQKKNQVSNEIGVLNNNITGIESKIEKTEEVIERLDSEIKKIEEEIVQKKESLADSLRGMHQVESEVSMFLLDENASLSQYFVLVDSLESLEDKLGVVVDDIRDKKEKQEENKKQQQLVYDEQDANKKELESQKAKKSWVLYKTNEEISKHEASISEIQGKISKLKSELSSLLGDGYDTDDIKDAIKYANKKTGVSKGFLFGMLSMESGLGKYTGGCYYKESNMNSTRKALFKDICKELDYNYKKKKVSCPPSGYSGTGGAMGVAQFMSDTWKGYEDKIASKTGHNPPDPWNLTDGVMAMALKLENDGATESGRVRIVNPCDKSEKIKVDWEDYAAMKYLGWSCYALTNYAPTVQALSKGYDKL